MICTSVCEYVYVCDLGSGLACVGVFILHSMMMTMTVIGCAASLLYNICAYVLSRQRCYKCTILYSNICHLNCEELSHNVRNSTAATTFSTYTSTGNLCIIKSAYPISTNNSIKLIINNMGAKCVNTFISCATLRHRIAIINDTTDLQSVYS